MHRRGGAKMHQVSFGGQPGCDWLASDPGERREYGGCRIVLVVVGHSTGLAPLDLQTGLGAVERLDPFVRR